MASTTRTIWQAQQAQTRQATVRSAAGEVTVRTRQQAEQLLMQQTEERIARQANAQQLYETQEQPSIYAGQGRVLPLGAAGPITPRALQTTGTNRIGNPVQLSQGIASSQPALGQDVDLTEIRADLADIAVGRGALVGTDNPNDTDGSGIKLAALYPNQLYWRSDIGALYRWQAGTEAAAGEWVALLQQSYGFGSPILDGVCHGATYTDEAGDAFYFWDVLDGQWHQAGGGGGVAQQSTQVRVDPPSPAHGQNTLLSWQEVDWDELGIFDAATPNIITFAQAGRYQIEFTTAAQTLSGGGWTSWRFYFDVEAGPIFGADDREHQTNHYFPVPSSEHLHIYKSWSVEFEAGATIQVYAQQYNQSSSNLSLGLGNDYPTLTITKLS